jgi:hypothetical protein
MVVRLQGKLNGMVDTQPVIIEKLIEQIIANKLGGDISDTLPVTLY